jgi:hypothetical protein
MFFLMIITVNREHSVLYCRLFEYKKLNSIQSTFLQRFYNQVNSY